MVAAVRDILPDLGEGFVVACLHTYKNDAEAVVHHVLEDSLPPELKTLDRRLAVWRPPAPTWVKDKGKGKARASADAEGPVAASVPAAAGSVAAPTKAASASTARAQTAPASAAPSALLVQRPASRRYRALFLVQGRKRRRSGGRWLTRSGGRWAGMVVPVLACACWARQRRQVPPV